MSVPRGHGLPSSPWPSPTAIPSVSGDGHLWRSADILAARRRQLRNRIATGLGAATLLFMVFGNALVGYVTSLTGALRDERERNVAMADSVREFKVALSAQTQRDVEVHTVSRGTPALPLLGRVTSKFASRRLHPILQVWRPHRGIDIPAPTGTLVRPVVAGRVLRVGRDWGLGNFVEIEHSSGMGGGTVTTRYAHLHRATVQRDQWVDAETSIGSVGATGLATAPHLHYEIIVDRRKWVDPLTHELRTIEIVPAALRRVTSAPSLRDEEGTQNTPVSGRNGLSRNTRAVERPAPRGASN
jgi:murein DD-endopeptidase MepM/ murein hydrolase activator NlpD